MARQRLPAARCALCQKRFPVTLVQPAPFEVPGMNACGRGARTRPRIQQVAAQQQFCTEGLDAQRRQCLTAFRTRRHRQLVLTQVRKLSVQPVIAARP
ncbi:Multidrug efflux pump subunit AcrA [Pseudomonas syringae pv. actinidiae]|uniref:Multidrug efflux pump subunit AcrA n=1 Tax=Pseudomonas syringae pv. actinidiae TaxID=103796 RepID=A0A2V0Q7R8_PSESF|nr:Multidrug efflux pump subunit AcrA [Pseudomonas syringae pv. actinidiae]